MEQIGETTFLLTSNEKRILDAPEERIELDDIDLDEATQRINRTYEYLQAMHAEDDQLLAHERAIAAQAFAELALDKMLLNNIINQLPINSESLSTSDITG